MSNSDGYLDLLHTTNNQIDSLLYELDSFSHQTETTIEQRFDIVPISRRLNEAKKYIQESIFLASKKKK